MNYAGAFEIKGLIKGYFVGIVDSKKNQRTDFGKKSQSINKFVSKWCITTDHVVSDRNAHSVLKRLNSIFVTKRK